jgi:hypothetical protein
MSISATTRLLMLLAPIYLWASSAKGADSTPPSKVYVECTSNEVIGGSLCYSIRQKIQSLHRYELSADGDGARYFIHLVSLDVLPTGRKDILSAVAVAYCEMSSGLELYKTVEIHLVGVNVIKRVADQITNKLDSIARR